ncbi:MAG: translation [Planctomycetota bacterium]|nr:MAG: translation [Planctomycetota bacterium]
MSDTRVFPLSRAVFQPDDLAEPARILAAGGLVAFPTETVYGLGTNAEKGSSVTRLLEVTRSPADRRLTLHLSQPWELDRWVRDISPAVRRLTRRFWPGPLTVVLRCADGETRGFRIPADEVARELLKLAAVPVVATSVNVAEAPPINDASTILKHFGGRIDAVVDGGPVVGPRQSTVVEVDEKGCRVSREGLVPRGEIEVACRRRILFVCSGNTCRSPMAEVLMRRALALRMGVGEDKVEEKGYAVESAGVGASPGAPISEDAARVLEEMGCRVRERKSRGLTVEMIREADHVFAMTRSHLSRVIEMAPEAAGRARRLDAARDIEDPVGAGVEAYRAAAKQIRKAIEGAVKSL